MSWCSAVVFSAVLAVSWGAEDLSFPPGFKFGAATAAYQVEGAWNASDKGESIWDRFVHEDPGRIFNQNNGDIACDSYNQVEKDIEIAAELGLHYYRFSLAWSRILPTGFPNQISKEGADYYNRLIDGLLAKGIEPFITLYHWDLPQPLQDLGGWANPLIADWFEDYARVVYTLYGDRVKLWVTLNEPVVTCDLCYIMGIFAPGIVSPDVGTYLCNKHAMLAHAKAWRVYDEEFKPKYHGRVSIANHLLWFEPLTEADTELADLARQHLAGRYCHPIYSKEGGWPASIEKLLEKNSRDRGYNRSILPTFTQEEKELVRGTYDFFAFNHYTSRKIRWAKEGETFSQWPLGDAEELNGKIEIPEHWTPAAASWFFVNPDGIRQQLLWLKEQYGDFEFMITENGMATFGGLEDHDRINFYREYLKQILIAIKEDGLNITHYTAWTLLDNFEWSDGYNVKFGFYEVDFEDPLRTRRPRLSAHWYKKVIQEHSLDVTNDEL
ncbi:myrosinase 1-like [Trichoplusia ni]|uniref:Myrosinase 1-like n=1 Tax=Trichoplusia ni TaxID=7111 RepID=A0A7E5VJK4_TRINI|nr:myrosinase 1-like [Trichoplusia ni]